MSAESEENDQYYNSRSHSESDISSQAGLDDILNKIQKKLQRKRKRPKPKIINNPIKIDNKGIVKSKIKMDIRDFMWVLTTEKKYITFTRVKNESELSQKFKGERFDSEEYIKEKHINKSNLDMDDLAELSRNDDINNIHLKDPKEAAPVPINQEGIDEIKIKEENFNQMKESILQLVRKKTIGDNDRQTIKNFINSVLNTKINQPMQRLNIVLDLDSTVINSTLMIKKEFFTCDNIVSFLISNKELNFPISLYYRPGLKEFFDITKSFCDYYVYTLSIPKYAETVIKFIEEKYDIKIKSFKSNTESKNEFKKDFSRFGIDRNQSYILDDQNDVWPREDFLINSKKFLSTFIGHVDPKKGKENDYLPLYYNQTDTNSYFATLPILRMSYNAIDCYRIPYHIEYEFSKKKQLEYIANALIKLRCISHILNKTSLALKLYRLTLLVGYCFDLNYFEGTSKIDISRMITSCGGDICPDKSERTHFIVSETEYDIYMSDIEEKPYLKKFKALNAKFIYDTFFFVTLMDEDDPEYSIDNVLEVTEKE